MSGFCRTHDPEAPQDMKELGRRGGSTPKMTALRRAAVEQDDSLRESARQVLADALAGKAVDKAQLDAARSLFAYRPAEIPRRAEREQEHEGRGVFSITDLVRRAIELGVVRVSSEGEVLIEGVPVEMTHTPSPQETAHRKALPPAPARQEVRSETPEEGYLGTAS